MPGNRKQQALSAAMVRTVNRPGMYADGNGLNLKVVSSGAKRWVQRVTIEGKRHNLGLGGYPAVSLAEARELAAEYQRAIRQGRDPLAEKHQSEEERRRPPVPAFAQAAEQVIEMRRPTWSNTKHASQWENTLRTYAHPVIGRKPVDEITTADVLAVLTPIWTVKPETASRVRQRLETVLDWTVATCSCCDRKGRGRQGLFHSFESGQVRGFPGLGSAPIGRLLLGTYHDAHDQRRGNQCPCHARVGVPV